MIDKLDYLKFAISNNNIENKDWYINCFAIPLLKDEVDWENKNSGEIVTKLDGLYYVKVDELANKELVKISGYVRDTPLFNFQDVIEVDNTWLPSIKGKIQTKIGNLIINALVIYHAFKHKLEYINEPIKISKLEKAIGQRVVSDDVAKETDITVTEMVTCMERFTFLTTFANILNIASTAKTISPPPNIDQIRKDILKEYEGQLHDPVKLVELEERLSKVDNEYLADDPVASKVFGSKSRIARKKMFLIYGETLSFTNETTAAPIKPSLTDGLSTTEEDFPKYMNDLRYGSYSRGASTQLGGYTYKILQRSLAGLSVSNTGCNTTRGLKRLITDSNANKLHNRYVLENKNWVLVKTPEQIKSYIGKTVEMRSLMYCTAPGNTVCYKCMSEVYKDTPNGITNIASELSRIILMLFMKLMHATQTESTTISVSDLAT